MTASERIIVERLKRERSELKTSLDRIIFDNNPHNGPIGLRIIAMTESK